MRFFRGVVGRVFVVGLCWGIVSGLPSSALAQTCDDSAKAVSVQGSVDAQRSGQSTWNAVRLNDEYCPGDTIRVNERSRADLLLADQSVLRLRENTVLVVEGVQEERSYILDLVEGAAHFFSRHGARTLEVKTPFTVAGVRGTEFALEVGSKSAVVRVFEGRVLAANDAGSVVLRSGESATAEKGAAPVLLVEARPRDAVRWALYYAPVMYPVPKQGEARSAWARSVMESAQAYRHGDLTQAFSLVEKVDAKKVTDADFFAYRASLFLAVGSMEKAERDIAHALQLSATNSDALALQTIIALAQNDKDKALESARRAVAANPQSATAYVALSYAQQARFDLESARSSLQEAVRLEPENALAWARLAELQSSFGDLDAAQDAADRAATIEPGLARTQTVLGFARLARVKTTQAMVAFTKAISLDSADPLPRLGLGLAKIRNGDLDGGGRDVEVAASLDPNNALVRSYLGKVYFEEKRAGLDEREYATAKKLDPNDPTPWFYDAIAKQTTNRPVLALRDLQKAIELNDNRAVYRSRLLLDSDFAARSASLGRTYSDLGFQNLALVQGWRSVNVDPSNYSAHRLLADSYSALPRHEIARVSELLQSQLLQPSNITPIQPRLGESNNLFLLSAQGPASLSFNEFNPLFNRNQVAVQATGLAGEDDTWSGEGIVSGIQDNVSFSAGYSGFQTDGFRVNNDQDDQIANAFVQVEVDEKTSVQVEGRYRDLRNGDLELRFLEDDFSPYSNEKNLTRSLRGGLRHAFSPNSTLLLSYIHQKLTTKFSDFIPDPFFGDFSIDLDVHETGDTVEAQYLYRTAFPKGAGTFVRNLNVIAGIGHATVDSTEITTTLIDIGFPIPPDVVVRMPDVRHRNLYVYSHVGLGEALTLTLGASGDFFEEMQGIGSKDQANPKVGLTWNPSWAPGTTVRAAAFRTLTRTLITQQTLEPTQVAGFNQFYDDPPGTDAWRYGAAVDQEFGDSIFGGLEVSKRDMHVPQSIFGGATFDVVTFDWNERLGRAYLFWTPHEWVSTRVEYEYEKMERDPDSLFAFQEVKTHRVPLGVQFFHPCGLGLSFGATYLRQKGIFLRNSDFTFESGKRDFWVLDAGIRYRLPNRYGFVSFGVNNFLDEDSPYQATDVRNPTTRPGRFIFGAVTLAFP